MPGRQNKTIAVDPVRVGGMVFEKARPQHICHGRRAQWQPWVPTIGFLHGIDGQKTQGIDAALVERNVGGNYR